MGTSAEHGPTQQAALWCMLHSLELQCTPFPTATYPSLVVHRNLGDIPDAACVHPKVLEFVFRSLLTAELDLAKARLLLACTICNIVKVELFVILPLSVRKDCIARNTVAYAFHQANVATNFNPQ
jgi:hypothetical protein